MQFLDKLSTEAASISTRQLFKKILLAWFLINTLQIVPYHDHIWGSQAVFPVTERNDGSLIWHMIDMLSFHLVNDFYLGAIALQVIAIVFALVTKGGPLLTLFIWLVSLNLYHSAGPMNDGGNNLAQLLLLYMVIVDFGHVYAKSLGSRFRIAFGNAAFIMSRVQVCIVYLTAGTLKVQGALWQKGMTLYYLSQSETFGHPLMRTFALEFPMLLSLATYMVMAFQICFPFLVWQPKVRPYIVAFGIMLHLGIAFGMGLLTFGLIMCASYALWIPDELARKILSKLRAFFDLRLPPSLVRAFAKQA